MVALSESAHSHMGAPPPGYQQEWVTHSVYVHGFASLSALPGEFEYVYLPEFTLLENHYWCLSIYPGGNKDATKGMVSLYLENRSNNAIEIDFGFSVIDSNQPNADFIEQYGHRFIDADVTQVENLRAAGIEYCTLLILAIDDVEDSMNLARHLRLNYPDLTIFIRARDRHHAHLINSLGIPNIWRETYASSLNLAMHALVRTGISSDEAQAQIDLFKQEDEQLLMQQHYLSQEQDIVESYPSSIAELQYLFENTKTTGLIVNRKVRKDFLATDSAD